MAGADRSFSVLTPSEWLGLISKATIVCTNSFHGASLALNTRRGLVFVPHLEEEKNARPVSLLHRTKLSDLIYYEGDRFSNDRFVDYDTRHLHDEIEKSKAFLLDSLK
jgi:hypothetical protein